MIRVSALERMLAVERLRRQATYGTGEFSTPVMQEVPVAPDTGPLVVTNMRNSFVATRRSKDGVARYAFSECLLEQEGQLITELFRKLWDLSREHEWPTRCTSIEQAMSQMEVSELKPHHLVIGQPLLAEACGAEFTIEEAEKRMAAQGFVTELSGVQVLAAAIPAKVAMVVAAPAVAGLYTRSDNRLGVMIQRANRSIMLVNRTET